MNSNLIEKLLINSYSLSQLRSRVRILRKYIGRKFFGETQTEELDEKESLWLASLGNDFLNQFDKLNAYEKLGELELAVNQIKPLIIYIAFDIPQEEIERLGIWLRAEINPGVLCEIKVDPSLIGGCALSWSGIYKDYSLRAQIQTQREQILSGFKQFSL